MESVIDAGVRTCIKAIVVLELCDFNIVCPALVEKDKWSTMKLNWKIWVPMNSLQIIVLRIRNILNDYLTMWLKQLSTEKLNEFQWTLHVGRFCNHPSLVNFSFYPTNANYLGEHLLYWVFVASDVVMSKISSQWRNSQSFCNCNRVSYASFVTMPYLTTFGLCKVQNW